VADIIMIISAIAVVMLFLLRVRDAYLARKFIKTNPEVFKHIVALEKNKSDAKTKGGNS
jgi:hypothetical protein